MLRSLLIGLAFAFVLPPPLHAGILQLRHDESIQRLRVYDGDSGSAVSQSSVGSGVQIGSVSADAFGDRVFFVANTAGAQTLYSLGYGAAGGVEQAALGADLRVTHLEWDGSGIARIVGIAVDTSVDAPLLVSFEAGTLVPLGMPVADCCRFRSAVSAYRASDDSLFLVGRVDGEVQDRIFRFTVGAVPSATSAPIDADLELVELSVASDGQLYGLGHSRAAALTRLVAFDAALQAEIRGPGVSGCCLVLAGSSAIDPASAELVVLGSASTGPAPNPLRLWRFNLGSGAIVDTGTPAAAVGLFYDASAIVPGGDLFSDGFEEGPALPRPAVGGAN
jgi:hypothetical protein